jgi:molybdopterin-guanine dinucleotide biosynthesis protein A
MLLGLVLAGGRSRRFGSDKAAIRVQGRALLEKTVILLQPSVEAVYVSVRADQTDDRLRREFSLLVDREADLGPAGGLLAAHALRPDAAWIVLACDLPFMDEAAVAHLIGSREVTRAATAYRSDDDGSPEPLCAIYEPDTLARFRHQVDTGGSLSPRGFLMSADVKCIKPSRGRVLLNVNTPDDLARNENESDAGSLENQGIKWNDER